MGDEEQLRQLFGGAVEARIPARFQDVSDFREVPDNQEVLADGSTDESVVIELLELKAGVEDGQAAAWFFRDLCSEQDATPPHDMDSCSPLTPAQVPHLDPDMAKSYAIGRMEVSKSREGPAAKNLVRCYLANLRLRSAATDVLITVYEPLVISEHSSSAAVLGAGPVLAAAEQGQAPAAQLFWDVLQSFKIKDWGLFASDK